PDHQRGPRNQPRRLRCLFEAARHDRVGVGRRFRQMRCAPLAAALIVAGAASASSVRDEITVGGAESTPQNPRAGNFSNLFGLSVDVAADWTVSGTAQVTLEEGTPAPAGSGFADGGGTVTDFSLGVEWDATDNWSIGVTLDVSPESAIATDAQFPVRTSQGT